LFGNEDFHLVLGGGLGFDHLSISPGDLEMSSKRVVLHYTDGYQYIDTQIIGEAPASSATTS